AHTLSALPPFSSLRNTYYYANITSDGEEAQRVADKWGEFQDEVDHTPRVLQKLSYKEASTLSCLECRGTTIETPGSKGWGTSCTNCHMSISLSAPEPAEDEKKTKKFSKPFSCFFCRTKIGYDAPYYRMLHPNGGVNSWNNMPRVVYLHADGEKCEGKPLPEESDYYKCSTCDYNGP
ncbi:unnamed protein product, partial [Ectocarpus sp. 8 AP-2014]